MVKYAEEGIAPYQFFKRPPTVSVKSTMGTAPVTVLCFALLPCTDCSFYK